MARKSARPVPNSNVMDANQVVAYNFRLAREQKGWTQDETAERLERPLGQRLKKASISSIERSVESDRRRVFSAQEVVAFAIAFDKPVVWFFLPPKPAEEWAPVRLEGTDRQLTDLLSLTLGTAGQMDDLKARLEAVYGTTDGEKADPDPIADSLLDESTKQAFGIGPQMPWEHYLAIRRDVLADHVAVERTKLEEFYEQMAGLMATFKEAERRMELSANYPRTPQKNISGMILGDKLFHVLKQDHRIGQKRMNHMELFQLVQRDDVPWEEIIDTTDSDVRAAIQDLARAIDPAVKRFVAETERP